MLKSLKTNKLIPAIILATLAGCATMPTQDKQQSQQVSLESANNQPSYYLGQINNKQTNEAQNRYMLLGVHAYLNQGDYQNANALLEQLKPALTDHQEIQAEYLYLSALSLTLQGKDTNALALLNYSEKWQLPDWQWIEYYQLKAKLFKNMHHSVEYIKQLSQLSQYYPRSERGQISDKIWHELQPLPTEIISLYTDDADAPIFSGWMQLAYIVKHYAVSPSELVRYLGQWQQKNRTHPAAAHLPSQLEKALNTKPFAPQTVAVLLPMSGTKANLANPIEQGILNGYFYNENSNVTVKFYDTALDVTQAYQQALAEGAEFIIGPLLQSNVEKIMKYQNDNGQMVPQLFLNKAESYTPSDNQFYFSLSSQEEASDAAYRLFQDGIKTPLLLTSSDSTGRRMAESFNKAWYKLTNKDAEVHYYQGGDKMKLAVQQAMGVKDSNARIAQIKSLLGNKIKADFRSRRDIDAIYMIAGPRDLTLLKPFIDVNFSVFTKPVPLYTSSRSRLAQNTSKTALELNNIRISDIPWLMKPSSENTKIHHLWPHWNNSQQRLFAMGFDSYELIGRLAQMRAFTGYQFSGHTGDLTVTTNGEINRHLSWGQYRRGKLLPL